MLNKRDNKFIFNFPLGFLHPKVSQIFNPIVQKLNLNYSDTLSYLNSTIQGINLPGFSVDTVEQFRNTEPIKLKSGTELHRGINKELTIKFKLTDGMLNWLIILMNSEYFLSHTNSNQFHPDFTLRILTNDNLQLFAYKIYMPQITSLDEGEFATTGNGIEGKSFTITIAFNRAEIKLEED